mmetsp:Transcript_86173/g.238891  ORF Transcript_86173/g.238891 Transcript_86173/m.238891 type:complete len:219 (-) Transcript_86173:1385-2041(-)
MRLPTSLYLSRMMASSMFIRTIDTKIMYMKYQITMKAYGMPDGRRGIESGISTYQPKSPISTIQQVFRLEAIEWNSLTSLPNSTWPMTAMQMNMTKNTIRKWTMSWEQPLSVSSTAFSRGFALKALKKRRMIEAALRATRMCSTKKSRRIKTRLFIIASSWLSLNSVRLGSILPLLSPPSMRLINVSACIEKHTDIQSPEFTSPSMMDVQSTTFHKLK